MLFISVFTWGVVTKLMISSGTQKQKSSWWFSKGIYN